MSNLLPIQRIEWLKNSAALAAAGAFALGLAGCKEGVSSKEPVATCTTSAASLQRSGFEGIDTLSEVAFETLPSSPTDEEIREMTLKIFDLNKDHLNDPDAIDKDTPLVLTEAQCQTLFTNWQLKTGKAINESPITGYRE